MCIWKRDSMIKKKLLLSLLMIFLYIIGISDGLVDCFDFGRLKGVGDVD